MSRLNWSKWHRTDNGEPMVRLRVDHYLTRDDITEILCASPPLETGISLSTDAIMHYVRHYLSVSSVLDSIEDWAHSYTEEEAEAREKWAAEQASKL